MARRRRRRARRDVRRARGRSRCLRARRRGPPAAQRAGGERARGAERPGDARPRSPSSRSCCAARAGGGARARAARGLDARARRRARRVAAEVVLRFSEPVEGASARSGSSTPTASASTPAAVTRPEGDATDRRRPAARPARRDVRRDVPRRLRRLASGQRRFRLHRRRGGLGRAPAVADLIGSGAGPGHRAAFGVARGVTYGATALLVGGFAFLLLVWRRAGNPGAAVARRARRRGTGAALAGLLAASPASSQRASASGTSSAALRRSRHDVRRRASACWAALEPDVLALFVGALRASGSLRERPAALAPGCAARARHREPGPRRLAPDGRRRAGARPAGRGGRRPRRDHARRHARPRRPRRRAEPVGACSSRSTCSTSSRCPPGSAAWRRSLARRPRRDACARARRPDAACSPRLLAALLAARARVRHHALRDRHRPVAAPHRRRSLAHRHRVRAGDPHQGRAARRPRRARRRPARRVVPALRRLADGGEAPGARRPRCCATLLRAEIALAAAVLAVTAALVAYPPPDSVAARPVLGDDADRHAQSLEATIDPAARRAQRDAPLPPRREDRRAVRRDRRACGHRRAAGPGHRPDRREAAQGRPGPLHVDAAPISSRRRLGARAEAAHGTASTSRAPRCRSRCADDDDRPAPPAGRPRLRPARAAPLPGRAPHRAGATRAGSTSGTPPFRPRRSSARAPLHPPSCRAAARSSPAASRAVLRRSGSPDTTTRPTNTGTPP